MKILVTGGAGFIGSAVCRHLIQNETDCVLNLDKMTYAGTLGSQNTIKDHKNYRFVQGDIGDCDTVLQLLKAFEIDAVMNLAAESHVDRSIDGPSDFIKTNIVGTYNLLMAAKAYWEGLDQAKKSNFRFHQVSTDEVFGDLPFDSGIFTEDTPYAPSSPYSASKASADHLVRAWGETYNLPVILSNCSNNYGPYQFPEKLIPLVTLNALAEKPLPIYGTGENVRDWLHVNDHARALTCVLKNGLIGESYNIGGNAEKTNLEVVRSICQILDSIKPRSKNKKYEELIEFVTDRPGHDRRYAIDASKIKEHLGWEPSFTFQNGLENTIKWYIENEWWWAPLKDEAFAGGRRGNLTTKQLEFEKKVNLDDVEIDGDRKVRPSSTMSQFLKQGWSD